MDIRVNGEIVKIYEGAKVKDVLRKYSTAEYNAVARGQKIVVDARGHEVGLDGELTGREDFQTREK